MRPSGMWSEALRNITSGTSRTLPVLTVAVLILIACTLADAVTVGALVRDAREFQLKGASVTTVTAPEGIDGRACDRLDEIPGIRSAGALRSSTSNLDATLLPRSPIPMFEVSPGFLGVVSSNSRSRGGISVPTEVTEALGLRPGDRLLAAQGPAIIAGTYEYPSDGRRPGFGWAALVPSSNNEIFDECWAEIWPSNEDLRSLLLGTVPTLEYSATGNQVVISQLNTQLGASYDGSSKFSERATLYSPIVATVAIFALSWFAVRGRRLELAAHLHDGMSRAQMQLLVVLEHASWLLPSTLLAGAVGVAYAMTVGAPDSLALAWAALGTQVMALTGGLLGTACSVHLVREQHLFAYFKDR